MKKVGKTYSIVFSYDQVKKNMHGWVDAKKYLPADYDLVSVKREKSKQTSAWTVGTKWEGLRIDPEDNILFWKRKVEKDHG